LIVKELIDFLKAFESAIWEFSHLGPLSLGIFTAERC